MTREGVIDASSEREIRERLEAEGLLLVELPKRRRTGWWPARGGVAHRELLWITRQLASLVSSGVPISESLEILLEDDRRGSSASEGRDRTSRLLEEVLSDVREGRSFSAALAAREGVFPDLYIHTVRAGESSGDLSRCLERLAGHLSRSEELRQQIVSAVTYPALLLVVSVSVLLFLGGFVVPAFSGILEDSRMGLPAVTRMVVAVSSGVRSHGALLLLIVVASGVAVAWYRRTPDGRLRLDRWMLGLPVIGPLSGKAGTVVFCQNLRTALEGGVPLVDGLEIASSALENRCQRAELRAAFEQVRQGGELHRALAKTPSFPVKASRMIRVGERGGDLAAILGHVAEHYRSEVSSTLLGLTRLLEPTLMIVMGVAIAVVLLALFLPILELAGTL